MKLTIYPLVNPKDALVGILRYKKYYKNWILASFHAIRDSYPFEVHLRDGRNISLRNADESYILSNKLQNKFKLDSDFLYLEFEGKNIKFLRKTNVGSGTVIDTFIDQAYEPLDPKGETVLDVGANIGDTAIYFSVRKAKEIIAIEPYPQNVEVMRLNFETNNIKNVTIINAGIGKDNDNMIIDGRTSVNGSFGLKESKNGTRVPVYSLSYIMKELRIEHCLLKMDCEGCEYDSILNTSDEDLSKIDRMLIEYHKGPEAIENKLKTAGYRVNSYQLKKEESHNYVGYIYAERLQTTQS